VIVWTTFVALLVLVPGHIAKQPMQLSSVARALARADHVESCDWYSLLIERPTTFRMVHMPRRAQLEQKVLFSERTEERNQPDTVVSYFNPNPIIQVGWRRGSGTAQGDGRTPFYAVSVNGLHRDRVSGRVGVSVRVRVRPCQAIYWHGVKWSSPQGDFSAS